MNAKSAIKYPLHLATDAQGPFGIFDADGKAVAMFSDTFSPVKGFAWKPQKEPTPDKDGMGGVTYWAERNEAVRAVFDLLNKAPKKMKP